jgi:hypothetical protein
MADIRNRKLTLADCRFDWVFHGYDNSFDNEATFSDIDGVVHLNGHFLFVEHKSMQRSDRQPTLPRGQLAVYEALSKIPNATCLLVSGDMQKSVPYYIETIPSDGVGIDLREFDDMSARKVLMAILNEWYKEATK